MAATPVFWEVKCISQGFKTVHLETGLSGLFKSKIYDQSFILVEIWMSSCNYFVCDCLKHVPFLLSQFFFGTDWFLLHVLLLDKTSTLH